MGRIADELGVQTYCFRAFKDNAKVAELVRQCGLSAVELCSGHIDFSDAGQHQAVVDTYAKAGVRIISIGVESLSTDEGSLRKRMDFMKLAGARVMGCDFAPGTTRAQHELAAGLAREYDIRLAIHNHGARHWLGPIQMLEHVFAEAAARGDDRLGLCLDTAWAMDSREDPIAMAQQFADRLYGLHIKDFVFDRAAQPEDVIVGTGNLDLPKLIKTVESAGFNGACVLEYEGDVDNPVPALTGCAQAVKNAS